MSLRGFCWTSYILTNWAHGSGLSTVCLSTRQPHSGLVPRLTWSSPGAHASLTTYLTAMLTYMIIPQLQIILSRLHWVTLSRHYTMDESIFCTSLNAVQNEKPVFYFKFGLTLTTFESALNTDPGPSVVLLYYIHCQARRGIVMFITIWHHCIAPTLFQSLGVSPDSQLFCCLVRSFTSRRPAQDLGRLARARRGRNDAQ